MNKIVNTVIPAKGEARFLYSMLYIRETVGLCKSMRGLLAEPILHLPVSVIPAEAGIQATHMLSTVTVSHDFISRLAWIPACTDVARK